MGTDLYLLGMQKTSAYTEVSPEIKARFKEIIIEKELKEIEFLIIGSDELKVPVSIKKATPLEYYLSDNSDVIIVVNEAMVDMFDDELKSLVIDEVMTSVSYNLEKEQLDFKKPTLNSYMGILKKYKLDTYEKLEESIKSAKESLKIK